MTVPMMSRRRFLRRGAGLVGGLGALSVLSPGHPARRWPAWRRRARPWTTSSTSSCSARRTGRSTTTSARCPGVVGLEDPDVPINPITGRSNLEQLDPSILDGSGGSLPAVATRSHEDARRSALLDVSHLWQDQHLSSAPATTGSSRRPTARSTSSSAIPTPPRRDADDELLRAERTCRSTTRWRIGLTICDRYFCSVLGPTNPEPALPDARVASTPTATQGGPEVNNIKSMLNTRDFSWTHRTPSSCEARHRLEGIPRERRLPGERPRLLRAVRRPDHRPPPARPQHHRRRSAHPRAPPRRRRAATCPRCRGSSAPSTRPSTRTSCRPTARLYTPGDPRGAHGRSEGLGQDPADPHLRRERRLLRPRPAAGPAAGDARRGAHRPRPGARARGSRLHRSHRARLAGADDADLAVHPRRLRVPRYVRPTSVLRLLEDAVRAEIPNLTPWRRETCGDLASAIPFGCTPRPHDPRPARRRRAARRGGRPVRLVARSPRCPPCSRSRSRRAVTRLRVGSRVRRSVVDGRGGGGSGSTTTTVPGRQRLPATGGGAERSLAVTAATAALAVALRRFHRGAPSAPPTPTGLYHRLHELECVRCARGTLVLERRMLRTARVRGGRGSALALELEEQLLFSGEPAAVAGEAPVGADHPVARDDDPDRVAAVGEAHGPRGARLADAVGEPAVAPGLAVGDLAQGRPHLLAGTGSRRAPAPGRSR